MRKNRHYSGWRIVCYRVIDFRYSTDYFKSKDSVVICFLVDALSTLTDDSTKQTHLAGGKVNHESA